MSYEIEALKLVLSENREWADWSAFVVIGSPVLEMIVLLIFSHGTGGSISHSMSIIIIGAAIAGVCGEYFFGSRANDAAVRLQQAADEKVASLTRDGALANERVAKAEKDATEARVELERMKAPRTIDAQHERVLIQRLKTMPGTRFFVVTQNNGTPYGGSEQDAFSQQMSRIFLAANWIKDNRVRINRRRESAFAPVTDRGCLLASSPVVPGPKLGQIVIDGLKEAGIHCQSTGNPDVRKGIVVLEIGLQ